MDRLPPKLAAELTRRTGVLADPSLEDAIRTQMLNKAQEIEQRLTLVERGSQSAQLTAACADITNPLSNGEPISGMPGPAGIVVLAGKRHEGFMEKLSPSAAKGWQQRYFVLENNQLMYFKEKDARAMFDELDKDDSGYLEEMEAASLCRTLGKKLNKKSMEKAMAEMDTSGDGKVSFEEFNAWWAQNAGKARAKSEPAGTIDLRQCQWVRSMRKRDQALRTVDMNQIVCVSCWIPQSEQSC